MEILESVATQRAARPRLAIRRAGHAIMRRGAFRIAARSRIRNPTGRGPVSLRSAALTARSSKSALAGSRFRRGGAGGTSCLISLPNDPIRKSFNDCEQLAGYREISGQANCVRELPQLQSVAEFVRIPQCRDRQVAEFVKIPPGMGRSTAALPAASALPLTSGSANVSGKA